MPLVCSALYSIRRRLILRFLQYLVDEEGEKSGGRAAGCFHMCGLCVPSHRTAGQDGFRKCVFLIGKRP